jgi:hypothetical protein
MRLWFPVIVFLTLAVAGCKSSTDTSATTGPATAAMNRILDNMAAKAGADRVEEPTWYTPENLSEYLNGPAASYVESGLRGMVHSEWHTSGATGPEYVDVDLYDMGSPLGALEIFANARSPDSQYLAIGNECQQTRTGLELRADRFFVRITARKDIGGQQDLVKSLAEAAAAVAGSGLPDTALISPLPSGKLLPHSARYQTNNYLGRDFLRNVKAATYDQYGKRVDLFVINSPSPEDASILLERWRSILPPPPIGAAIDPNRMEWNEPLVGSMTVARKGRWLAGVIGDSATSRSVLDSFIARLD